MKIIRCSDQKARTLDEFYSDLLSKDDLAKSTGEATSSLIARLRALEDERVVYGLTSHYSLCLLSRDDYSSPGYVTISASCESDYTIEYLMPSDQAPWHRPARVSGIARSEDEAVEMILIAMEQSRGWTDSEF